METPTPAKRRRLPLPVRLVFRDPLNTVALFFLVIVMLCAAFGPLLIDVLAERPNFRARNMAPFSLEQGFAYVLGADTLGRSLLARLIAGARSTMGIAAVAVLFSLLVGGMLGLIAGYSRGWLGNAILRATDIVMSFPSLLLALIVLFSLGPSIPNLILVLAITRIPIYLRTARAEVLEVRERMFVAAATALGAGHLRLVFRHIAPMVVPTLLTIGAIDFATVVLAESSLSFLGLGIQSPNFTWGSMVATGRGYLTNAWWVAFWPGLAILLTTLSLNILSSWWRTYSDPHQRWRLELRRKAKGKGQTEHQSMTAVPSPLLTVENLTVDFLSGEGSFRATNEVSFHVDAGETLVILGESGSGKSVSASAIMGLIDTPPGEIVSGRICWRGTDVTHMTEEKRRIFNGSKVAIIFQDPLSHLNPVYTIGWQLAEVYTAHGKCGEAEARKRGIEVLRRVGIPEPEERFDWYPHQFSGGQRQRIMIGMAIALGPELLIADEPTTALDVNLQAQILDLMKRLQREEGLAIIMITHDLEVAANMADRVVVMNAGRIVEQGPARGVFESPQHGYTQRLMTALPHADTIVAKPQASTPAILEVSHLTKVYGIVGNMKPTPTMPRAVDDVSFSLAAGETLGIVGESGSGKSTVAKMLLRLTTSTEGKTIYHGKDLLGMDRREMLAYRRRVQMVFQDPYSSMNPRMTVFSIISEPWQIHRDILAKPLWRARVAELLRLVGLQPDHADRYPHQFSGGQRQRIAIARALACDPELIICDEAVSALDVSIQMQIIALLAELRDKSGLAYIFITHDLSIVRNFADRILVMKSGKIVEEQRADALFRHPIAPYTRTLINAAPKPKWDKMSETARLTV